MKIKPRKFYHRVSFDAVEHLKRELGHNINIQAPQTQYIPHLLGKICPRSLKVRNVPCGLLNPSAIGDQHLRLMYADLVALYDFCDDPLSAPCLCYYISYENPSQYLVRIQLVAFSIQVTADGHLRAKFICCDNCLLRYVIYVRQFLHSFGRTLFLGHKSSSPVRSLRIV